jgi:crotonobetainyl-CoA:carnitine CoA-transferase CaiB-like acyl-CoA transferase
MRGALHNLKILDFSRVLAGPYCAQVLGDYGADVIKVEQPGLGDGTRQWGPPWAGEHSAYFLSANRNKRSLTLDLKSPEGIAIARKLIERSDVLIENFLPGTMAKLGLGFDAARALNPRLIYCSITGYGQTGPRRNEPGYDAMIQAQSGWMSITGPAHGDPHKAGVALADVIAGLFAANAILAALHHRERTGVGQHIDVALFDAALAALVNVAHNALVTGVAPARHGNAHPSIVPYQSFATRDGGIMLAVGTDAQFQRLCDVLGCADLKADPHFVSNPLRVQHRDALISMLARAFAQRATQEWLDALAPAGIPASAITDVLTALNDPQVQAREMVQTVNGENMLGPVVKLSATPARIQSAPPQLGEHTDEILRELGCSAEQIAVWRRDAVV